MGTARPLTIAVPKGRTLGPLGDVLARAGVDIGPLTAKGRALVRPSTAGDLALQFLLLKSDDVPTYVEYGAADLGVCGRDILTERGCDVYQPLDLGIGRCRLVVAGRASASAPSLDGALYGASALSRVATKYPRSAERHFARRGLQVEIVNVSSSVELAPIMGLSDLIVDLVETGTTLVENGLEVKEDVYAVSTLLIANRVSYKVRAAEIGPLVARLRDAVAAAPAA